MTYTVSEHDLWTPEQNQVRVMEPAPDDLFVVITVNGKRALVWPITDYDRAVQVANGFVNRVRGPRPVTIKVRCMSGTELMDHMGLTHGTAAQNLSPKDGADRQLMIETCKSALLKSNDAAVRADAHDLLTRLGALK